MYCITHIIGQPNLLQRPVYSKLVMVVSTAELFILGASEHAKLFIDILAELIYRGYEDYTSLGAS